MFILFASAGRTSPRAWDAFYRETRELGSFRVSRAVRLPSPSARQDQKCKLWLGG